MTALSTGLVAPRLPEPATGFSTAFGTFGELLQGVLPGDDRDFLVTLPIARWSAARFAPSPGSRSLEVRPAHKTKALRAARIVLEAAGAAAEGVLTVETGLPEGKGMASSSADLVATVRAVSNALGTEASAALVESVLRGIEPTDGVMYQGITAFYHREVRVREVLGSLPQLTVVGLDEGGSIDTIAFNRIPKPFSAAEKEEYAELLGRLGRAVRAADLAEVGAVATRSAVLNQGLRPKRTLADVVEICCQVRGLGVVNSHSGTTIGVLLDDDDPDYSDKLAHVANAFRALAGNATVYRSVCFDQ